MLLEPRMRPSEKRKEFTEANDMNYHTVTKIWVRLHWDASSDPLKYLMLIRHYIQYCHVQFIFQNLTNRKGMIDWFSCHKGNARSITKLLKILRQTKLKSHHVLHFIIAIGYKLRHFFILNEVWSFWVFKALSRWSFSDQAHVSIHTNNHVFLKEILGM